jgi:hypothetical protein
MQTAELINKLHRRRGSYLTMALLLVAGITRVPPIFVEQVIPVVRAFLLRLRTLPIFAR